jgi:hypothetical protein
MEVLEILGWIVIVILIILIMIFIDSIIKVPFKDYGEKIRRIKNKFKKK